MKSEKKIDNFFYSLQNRETLPPKDRLTAPLYDEYARIRSSIDDLPFHTLNRRPNVLQYAANNYKACFINNISIPTRKRLKTFLNFLYPRDRVEETLNYLLKSSGEQRYNKVAHLKSIREWSNPPHGHFRRLQKDLNLYIEPLWKLSRFFDSKQIGHFPIVPMYRFGRHYVQMDSKFIATSNLEPILAVNKVEDPPGMWGRYFNFEQFETSGHFFDYEIKSNGHATSIQMRRLKWYGTETDQQKTTKETTLDGNNRRQI